MTPIEIFNSSFLSKIVRWKVPSSDLSYPIVTLAPTCMSNLFGNDPIILFELFFKEIYENFVLSSKLILDISLVKEQSLLLNLLSEHTNPYLDILLIVSQTNKKPRDLEQIHFVDSIEEGILEILNLNGKGDNNAKPIDLRNTNSSKISILPYNLPDTHDLRFSMFTEEFEAKKIGYVKMTGNSGVGSENSEEVALLNRKINQFDKLFAPDFLILDFKKLDYSWGNDFSVYPNRFRYVNLTKNEYESLYLILSDEQIEGGFKSVLFQPEDRIKPSLESALDDIKKKIKSM